MKKYGFAGLFLITSLFLHASQEGQAVPRPSLAKRQAFNRQYTDIQESFMNFVAQSTCPRIVLVSQLIHQANKDKDMSKHLHCLAKGVIDLEKLVVSDARREEKQMDSLFASLLKMNDTAAELEKRMRNHTMSGKEIVKKDNSLFQAKMRTAMENKERAKKNSFSDGTLDTSF